MAKVLTHVYRCLSRTFSVDTRSLALVRVGLSVFLILDTLVRLSDFEAHYTDLGVYPLDRAIDWSNGVHFSLYYMSSWAWFQWLLLVASLLPSLFLLLGYQTRVSGFLCWIFLTSIQNRNMMVLNGGDDYLRLVLMWCCFLPWNRCFSVDSAIQQAQGRKRAYKGNHHRILHVASVAVILQLCWVYIEGFILKTGSHWREGSAVYYALQDKQFTTKLGLFILRAVPTSYLRILSHGTLFIEVMAPLLILCPVFNSIGRMLGALLLMSMHCGFALCMEIGFFPFLPLVCLWIVVPEDFWAWATRNFVSRSARNIHICYFPDEPLAVYVAHLIDAFFFLGFARVVPLEGKAGGALRCKSFVVVGEGKSAAEPQRHIHEYHLDTVPEHSMSGGMGGCGALPTIFKFSPWMSLIYSVFTKLTNWSFGWKSLSPRLFLLLRSTLSDTLPISGSTSRVKHAPHPRSRQRNTKLLEYDSVLSQSAVACLLLYTVMNVSVPHSYNIPFPMAWRYLYWLGPFLQVDQYWNMFSPNTPYHSGWMGISVHTARPQSAGNSSLVELDFFPNYCSQGGSWRHYFTWIFGEGCHNPPEVKWHAPRFSPISSSYRGQRWRKYMDNLRRETFAVHREAHAMYVCRLWKREFGVLPPRVDLVYFQLNTAPPGHNYEAMREAYKGKALKRKINILHTSYCGQEPIELSMFEHNFDDEDVHEEVPGGTDV